MNDDEKNDLIITEKFQHGFSGIIHNSGGIVELFFTKFSLYSLILAVFVSILYWFNIKSVEESLRILEAINSSALSLLGGIVGLSLAGLTMVVTFSNPEIIVRSSEKQAKEFSEYKNFNVSYFQKAIAKFSFIVFFQVLTLVFFLIISTIKNFNIIVPSGFAYWINFSVFSIGIFSLIFSLILVIASIMNIFTFSQTSNFFNFLNHNASDLDKK